jgi:hypothetical protein
VVSTEEARQADGARPLVGSFLAAKVRLKVVKRRAADMMTRFVCKNPREPGDGHPLVAG